MCPPGKLPKQPPEKIEWTGPPGIKSKRGKGGSDVGVHAAKGGTGIAQGGVSSAISNGAHLCHGTSSGVMAGGSLGGGGGSLGGGGGSLGGGGGRGGGNGTSPSRAGSAAVEAAS